MISRYVVEEQIDIDVKGVDGKLSLKIIAGKGKRDQWDDEVAK